MTTLLNKGQWAVLAVVALLLLVPFTAMQFTAEVNWSPFDFALMGALMLLTGFALEWVARKTTARPKRLLLMAGVLLAFLLVWAELAVGVFGTPFAGN
jgi:hypothetical protein